MNKLRQCPLPLFLLSLCVSGSTTILAARYRTGSGSDPASEENAYYTSARSLPLPVLYRASLPLPVPYRASLPLPAPFASPGSFQQSPDKRLERERERAYAREQFSKNFRDLQLIGKGMLQAHEEPKLTRGKLDKNVRSINKCARALRSLIALGEMASEKPINKEINSGREFDQSIHLLATLISDFAHNPVH